MSWATIRNQLAKTCLLLLIISTSFIFLFIYFFNQPDQAIVPLTWFLLALWTLHKGGGGDMMKDTALSSPFSASSYRASYKTDSFFFLQNTQKWFADTVFNVSQQWATNILDELFPEEVVQIPSTINVISTMTTGLWQNKKSSKTMLFYRNTVQLRPQTLQ